MFGWKDDDGDVSPWGASVDLSTLDGTSGFSLEGSATEGHFGWARVVGWMLLFSAWGNGPANFRRFFQAPKRLLGSCPAAPGISIGVGGNFCWRFVTGCLWGLIFFPIISRACLLLLSAGGKAEESGVIVAS